MTSGKTMDMTTGKALPIIVRFTIPVLLGNLFQQFYNLADTLIVGRLLGSNALAAVGSTGTLMFLMTGFTGGLTTGFSVQTAQTYGAKDYGHMIRSVANAMLLSILVTVFATLFSVLFMHPLLKLMNTPAEIYQDAYSYIIVIGYGMGASVFYNLATAILRSVGNSRAPLIFLALSSILNIFLDILFIGPFGMGTMGAAAATVLSQGVSAAACLVYMNRHIRMLWPKKGEWHFNKEDTKFQLWIGIPMAIQYGVTASGNMIKQSAINIFGADAIAACTASGKFQTMLTPGMFSMGQTMATWTGQNYGKGSLERIRQGVKTSSLTILIYAVIVGILSLFLVRPVIGLFFTEASEIETMLPYAQTYLYVCVPFYFVLGMIFISRSALQGCGSSVIPLIGGIAEFAARLVTAMIAMQAGSFTLACFCDPAAWLFCCPVLVAGYFAIIKKETMKKMNTGNLMS